MAILASLEVYHSRLATPVRRVALGAVHLPVDPSPGYGGLLLAGTLSHHLTLVDEGWHDDIHELIDEVSSGRRIPQPRLRHRLEIARHGLARSTQRLLAGSVERPGDVTFSLECNGTPIQQVLAATYALTRLPVESRAATAELLRRATRWTTPLGPPFVAYLTGRARPDLRRRTGDSDAVGWALEQLGLDVATTHSETAVQRRFRTVLRSVHPDTGGDPQAASSRIADLGEARRILLRWPRGLRERQR